MSLSALVAVVLAAAPAVVPVPIGSSGAYRPPARTASVAAGEPVAGLRCARGGARFAIHVELFAAGRAVVVPAGIGVATPFSSKLGAVVPGACSYPVRTLTPTGIFGVLKGSGLRLADLFRVWGQPLGRTRLAAFSSSSPVRAYLAGRRYQGDIGALPLTPNAQIVLEVGAFVPPHPSFLFPKGPA